MKKRKRHVLLSLVLALICLAIVAAAGFAAWVFAAPPATGDRAEMDRSFGGFRVRACHETTWAS